RRSAARPPRPPRPRPGRRRGDLGGRHRRRRERSPGGPGSRRRRTQPRPGERLHHRRAGGLRGPAPADLQRTRPPRRVTHLPLNQPYVITYQNAKAHQPTRNTAVKTSEPRASPAPRSPVCRICRSASTASTAGARGRPQTRTQARRAAERIEDVTRRTRIVHIDVDDRDAETTGLLVALHRLVAVGPDLPRARRTAGTVVKRLDELIPGARPLSGRLRRLVSGRRRRARAEQAAAELAELSAPEVSDRAAAEGFLPDDLTERVGVPPRRRARLPAPQPAGCDHGAVRPGPHGRVGGVQYGRRGGLPCGGAVGAAADGA